MKGGGRGYIIYIRARNMCAQTEAGKRENRNMRVRGKEKNNIYWLDEVLVIKLGLYFFLEKSKCQKEGQNSNRLLSVDL